MSLKILCAGCTSEERYALEAGVRAGLGDRARRDPWIVSLVKFGNGWSVTLDGPTVKDRRSSFMVAAPAGPQAVAEAIRCAADPATASVLAPAVDLDGRSGAVRPPEGRRDAHTCEMCSGQYVVAYEAVPDEPLEEAPVACPHCWRIVKVQVARSVSFDRDYRADKI
jgi:hypothetical protein